VSIDPTGKNALVAHYAAATVSVVPIGPDGKLSPTTVRIKQTGSSVNPERQTHAYAHSINPSPDGRFAIACDLGADKLFIYKLDADKGILTPNDPPSVSVPPGSGPRHLVFHPNGKWVYIVTEMGGTVIGYDYDAAKGTLQQMDLVHTLKEGFKGNNTSAEVQIDPTGRFLYASNRLDTNYLTIYSIDQSNGKLTLVGYQDSMGKVPRNFRLDPTGKFLLVANQDSSNLALFSVNQQDGKLTFVPPTMSVRNPICVKFVAVEE
jgi:6-phosphogluconolactonase